MRYLYMAVTADRYELPMAVADSPRELAQMLGKKPATVRTELCQHKRGNRNGIRMGYTLKRIEV